MSLVNDSLKFTSSDTQMFCWKNVSSFCSAKATHIFSAKNIRILCIESARTVNEMTLNKLVKLTTLWTTGPRTFSAYRLRLPFARCGLYDYWIYIYKFLKLQLWHIQYMFIWPSLRVHLCHMKEYQIFHKHKFNNPFNTHSKIAVYILNVCLFQAKLYSLL